MDDTAPGHGLRALARFAASVDARTLPADVVEKAAEVRRLLRLAPAQDKFTLTYSPMRGGEGEMAVNSRSMLQIMSAFASYMDVPPEHLKDHSATPAFEHRPGAAGAQNVRIYSGKKKPAAPFAAVHFRDHWYWVSDGDWRTKRALTAVSKSKSGPLSST